MKDNFTQKGKVPALHNEDSYATRLYDYMGVKNQMDWGVARLRAEPRLRSAAVTTFEPLRDDKYIPCVSLLDFNVEGNVLCLYVYCRALDLGTKAYGNLAMLYALLADVAEKLAMKPGKMDLSIKSAHIYERNLDRVSAIVSSARRCLQ